VLAEVPERFHCVHVLSDSPLEFQCLPDKRKAPPATGRPFKLPSFFGPFFDVPIVAGEAFGLLADTDNLRFADSAEGGRAALAGKAKNGEVVAKL
jgi:hypothetical protein